MHDKRIGVVAIVDDDQGHRESLRFLLEASGYKVITFASAAAFLADRGLCPACLIADQHMPRMTGLELAVQLRRDKANIPILLMTGGPSPAINLKAAQSGIWGVLVKPFDKDDLLEFVKLHI